MIIYDLGGKAVHEAHCFCIDFRLVSLRRRHEEKLAGNYIDNSPFIK
jgi:hypothetical protein